MIVVTGGAGFIGSAVIWALNRLGKTDILIVDNLASTEKWKNLTNLRFMDYVHKDKFIARVKDDEWLNGISAVVHMGACSSTTETDADYFMENNYHYSRDLCAICLEKNIRFINASSAATYGDGSLGFSDSLELVPSLRPLNMYGYSKHLFDLWALSKGLFGRIAGLKFFNVYGPNEYHKGNMRSVICKAVSQIKETESISLFASDRPDYIDGGQLRDFVYVKDCAGLITWLWQNQHVNGLFNVGVGKARTWNDLAKAVFSATNLPPFIKYVPLPEDLRGKYQYFTEADMRWTEREVCPVKFRSLEEGVADYVKNYLNTDDPYLGNKLELENRSPSV